MQPQSENDQEQLASILPSFLPPKIKYGRNHHKPWLKYAINEEKNAKKPEGEKHDENNEKKGKNKKPIHQKDNKQNNDKQNNDEDGTKKDQKKWTAKRILGASAVALLLVIGAVYFFYERYTYESTDDALVQAHSTLLAPKVSGIVNQVLIDEHQRVSAGQVLVRLEQKDYLSALASARANLGSVQVQYRNAQRDFTRAAQLYREHAVTHQNYDHAYANYQDLDRQVKAAQASVDQAQLNLEYTEVRAPTDGYVSRKSVEVGMNAVAGTALLGFVQNDDRWVIANFKETQLDSVKIGKQVNVTVDAIPGKKFQGVVESISPSSGATFTLFPPDNATGNFTKVVQRVPVKIYLKNLTSDDLRLLQAGLSAEVAVIKHSDLETLPPHENTAYLSQFADSLPNANEDRASERESVKTTQSSREEQEALPSPPPAR